MRPTKKSVPVKLDKVRHLRMDFNALAFIEDKTGKNLLQQESWNNLTATDMRTIIWAMLLWEDPEITVDQVGENIDLENIDYISEQLHKVLELSNVEVQEGDEENPQ